MGGLSRSECCMLCVRQNRREPGVCKVAVVSSPSDVPPEACWIKKTALKAVRKAGVVSCIPNDQVKELPRLHDESTSSDRGGRGFNKHGSHKYGGHKHGGHKHES